MSLEAFSKQNMNLSSVFIIYIINNIIISILHVKFSKSLLFSTEKIAALVQKEI